MLHSMVQKLSDLARFLMKFCSACGHAVILRIPAGDQRARFVCTHCHAIHYQNPRNVVGALPVWGDQVLLCRRAIEPRYGFWTLPAGFMELGETTAQAARRETLEEAGARVELLPLFSLLNVVRAHQVHLFIAHGLLIWMCALAMKVLKSDYLKKRRFPGSKSLSEPSTKRCASFLQTARMAALVCIRRILNLDS